MVRGGGGDDLAEEDLDWDRQRTVPAPERVAGEGGAAATSERHVDGDDSVDRSSQWNRQHTSPAQQKPFDLASPRTGSARDGAVEGGQSAGRTRNPPAQWYYKDWFGEYGPRTLMDLTKALQKGYFSPTTLVRKEGQDRWSTLRDVLDLRQALRARRATNTVKDEVTRSQRRGGGREGVGKVQQSKTKEGDKASFAADVAVPAVDDTFIAQLFKPGGPDWFYIDIQGQIQGPFKSVKMAKWWGNPQYRGYFSTLKCRQGGSGPFQLLSEFKPLPDTSSAEGNGSVALGSPGLTATRPRLDLGSTRLQQRATKEANKKAEAVEELVKELEGRLEQAEEENERLRQEVEDTLMLRMQLEQLCRDKTALAAEVSQLKRDKEGLQELLQYAQQYEADEELLADELGDDEFDNDNVVEEDEGTKKWLEELKQHQMEHPVTQ